MAGADEDALSELARRAYPALVDVRARRSSNRGRVFTYAVTHEYGPVVYRLLEVIGENDASVRADFTACLEALARSRTEGLCNDPPTK